MQRQLAALQSVRKAAESELTCQKLITKEREQAVKAKVALALMNESPTDQAERFEFQRRLAISADVAAKLAGEVGHGNEDAPGDDLTLNFGEPEFDLIQARGGQGGHWALLTFSLLKDEPGIMDLPRNWTSKNARCCPHIGRYGCE